jgi:hypothetical protein
MNLTKEDKEFIKLLIKNELKEFKKEGKTIIEQDKPSFLAAEAKYEDLLKALLKKFK